MRDLLKEFFSEVYVFENSLESPFELGRRMKQERVAHGAVGLNLGPVPSATLGDHVVDLRHLQNTYSFLALMW